MKFSVRAFLAAFFCSLALSGLVFGFVLVDRNTRLTGLRDNEPFFTHQRTSDLNWDVQLFGVEATISLAPLNTAAAYAQHFFFCVPAGSRLLLRLAPAVVL